MDQYSDLRERLEAAGIDENGYWEILATEGSLIRPPQIERPAIVLVIDSIPDEAAKRETKLEEPDKPKFPYDRGFIAGLKEARGSVWMIDTLVDHPAAKYHPNRVKISAEDALARQESGLQKYIAYLEEKILEKENQTDETLRDRIIENAKEIGKWLAEEGPMRSEEDSYFSPYYANPYEYEGGYSQWLTEILARKPEAMAWANLPVIENAYAYLGDQTIPDHIAGLLHLAVEDDRIPVLHKVLEDACTQSFWDTLDDMARADAIRLQKEEEEEERRENYPTPEEVLFDLKQQWHRE